MSIKCIGVRSGIIFDKVSFQATKLHEASYDTIMGTKIFFVEKNEEFTLKMSKNEMWKIGDKAKNLEKLITNFNQFKFAWYWKE